MARPKRRRPCAPPAPTLLLLCLPRLQSATPPDVVFLLADDLGYNEMNFMNQTRGIQTPHLDRLAFDGIILKNYYVQPICSPTRSALLTGRYTIRLGTQSNVVWYDSPWGLPLNETLLSQNLGDAGYSTALFGKWHLGMYKQEYTPARRGFDEHMGYYQGCESRYTHVSACCTPGSSNDDMNMTCAQLGTDGTNGTQRGCEFALGYDWWKTGPAPHGGNSVPDLSVNRTSSALLLRDASIDFIRRAGLRPDRPFFLYIPFQNVHNPYTVAEEYRQLYAAASFTADERTLFGYISEMDDVVGAIVAALNSNTSSTSSGTSNGLAGAPAAVSLPRYDNSIIIFSSDNVSRLDTHTHTSFCVGAA